MSSIRKNRVFSILLLIVVCGAFVLGVNGAPTHADQKYQKQYGRLLGVKPSASSDTQKEAVYGLIGRLVRHLKKDEIERNFHIDIDESFVDNSSPQKLDRFSISASNGSVHIRATTGVAAANGFYYYLKRYANGSVTWSGDQLGSLKTFKVPLPVHGHEQTLLDKFRYYENVCTASYSAVWWSWARWEREIDWMALHGINLPLAPVGQELIYRRTFVNHFNLTVKQADDFFTGPAFLAWNRMGNMQRYTGPLSEHWHTEQAVLQKKILKRMRSFGMFSVTPTFGGHVPEALKRISPKTLITKSTDWNSFGKNYSFTSFLEPEDPMFEVATREYIKEYEKEYGTDHFYNIDLFNEETPRSSEPEYLKKCAEGVWRGVEQADAKGIWVMQGWLFAYSRFWQPPQVKAMVTAVPMGSMLILDLFSDVSPAYSRFEGYYGVPFLWCMLHNFGGASGMYAAFNRINGDAPIDNSSSVFGARKLYPNMFGSGLTPEGIEQNPAAYEYMTETIWWHDAPNQHDWFKNYTISRYGFFSIDLVDAWMLIRRSAYQDPIGLHNHGRYAINRRPSVGYHSDLWYSPRDMSEALKLFTKVLTIYPAAVQTEGFAYDISDVARQVVQLVFDHRKEFGYVPAFEFKQLELMKLYAAKMLQCFDWMEELMRTTRFTLLSNWVRDARALAQNAEEADLFEENARNQITLWGYKANILDYANKHWAGLISNYYKPRWALFFQETAEAVANNTIFNDKKFAADVYEKVEYPFTLIKNSNPISVHADAAKLNATLQHILAEVHSTLDKFEHPELPQFINPEESF